MPTSLEAIAKKAKEHPTYRFRNLAVMLDEAFLKDCWHDIKKNAAYGVDKVSAADYEKNLDENIQQLVERLKRGGYHAKLVKRKYIPKGEGKFRPLGIPATEDKLLQLAVARILEAIYEQDFLRCSYGYRPNLSPLEAVDKLTLKLQFGQYHFIVEADIKGFFDNIDHDWLIQMLEERIDDGQLLRLIKKWLKAGVLDTDGKVLHPITGTPQGGVVSPILANVYLHYALDIWFHKVVKPSCQGEACLIRFADDFVAAFEYQHEAERFYNLLGQRLAKFGLELSAAKTRIIPFNRTQSKTSFDFLGFEFRWGKDRAGKPHLKRRTAPKKLRKSIQNFTEWCKQNRQLRLPDLFQQLNAKLRGYFNYYGVHGNSSSVYHFFQQVTEILFKWLNRRSQRHSFNWDSFKRLLNRFDIVRPHIVGRPKTRLATGWT
jgi:group II intron reverse transcriptase/maturase